MDSDSHIDKSWAAWWPITERVVSPVVVAMSSELHGASYEENGVASNSGHAAEVRQSEPEEVGVDRRTRTYTDPKEVRTPRGVRPKGSSVG